MPYPFDHLKQFLKQKIEGFIGHFYIKCTMGTIEVIKVFPFCQFLIQIENIVQASAAEAL